ncbi:hypothetical protein AC1031_003823 [Aphanomyces cochlioides]|nr:hypothetical protein AC1031_003823 [Aphanomyces cochlioides]
MTTAMKKSGQPTRETKAASDFGELSDVIVPPQTESIEVGEALDQELRMDVGLHEDVVLPPSDAYVSLCYNLGILSHTQFNDVASFGVLKEKVRQLALRSGFRVRAQRPSSGHRRVWICMSRARCPFAVVGNKNKRGVSIMAGVSHNHALNCNTEAANLSLCEASTREMASFVRNSELYIESTDVTKITAQQISNIVHSKTGYHINAMRASRIKHLLLDDPGSFFAAETSSSASPADSPTFLAPASSWKTLAEAVWDGFMLIVNDPYTVQTLGVPAIKKMVATFRKVSHKDTLRGIVLMSCPNPESPPSSTTNRPSAIKFVDNYRRQEQFGFFD